MIFVTVGTQLPFDRLIRAIDAWAGDSGTGDVFAQIGPTEYEPDHIAWTRDLDPAGFSTRVREADLIIAHAGMGTIITALRNHAQLIVVPRHADKGEHRNDHQIATVRELSERGLIHAAHDEDELIRMLGDRTSLPTLPELPDFANDDLLGFVRGFVFGQS